MLAIFQFLTLWGSEKESKPYCYNVYQLYVTMVFMHRIYSFPQVIHGSSAYNVIIGSKLGVRFLEGQALLSGFYNV